MKVLVTGGTGFVGRHLVEKLLERGHEVTVLSRNEHRETPLQWERDVRWMHGDLAATSTALSCAGNDALAHLAWPDLPHYGRLSHFESALPAHYAFVKSVVGTGVRHVLVTGTCFEYGLMSGCLSENVATQPANPYALAKDCLRKFLQALAVDQPFRLQWARLFYMYGPGQHARSLLEQLDRAIREGRPTFDMSGGEQLRDYLPVESVAKLLASLLEHPDAEGIFNVCSGTPTTVRSLAEQRVRESGSPLRLNLGALPYSPLEPMAFWGDNSRLASVLGEIA
jgi:nucleoside-diphosphate-sugar epimerase